MRIRTVKPEWLEDERLALASSDARVMSIALICMADDYGRGRAGLAQLAGRVFPGQPVAVAEDAIADLEAVRYVRRYEVDGQRYYEIRNWQKHQRLDTHGRGLRGLVPPPPGLVNEPDGPEDCAPPAEDARPPGGECPPPRRPGPGPGPLPGSLPGPGSHLTRACVREATAAEVASAGMPADPDWVHVLAAFDAAWARHHGCALGVEMAAAQHRQRSEGVVAWARLQAGDGWLELVRRAVDAAARDMGPTVRAPYAAWASQPGAALARRGQGAAQPRRNDEFDHDDPDTFWANVAKEQDNAAQ